MLCKGIYFHIFMIIITFTTSLTRIVETIYAQTKTLIDIGSDSALNAINRRQLLRIKQEENPQHAMSRKKTMEPLS